MKFCVNLCLELNLQLSQMLSLKMNLTMSPKLSLDLYETNILVQFLYILIYMLSVASYM